MRLFSPFQGSLGANAFLIWEMSATDPSRKWRFRRSLPQLGTALQIMDFVRLSALENRNWESSKSDPFSLGKIIRHTFALALAPKVKKSQAFCASVASDSTSCSSSFCTFSLFTRHSRWWISCVCQHLKIVWESSKSDPASFSKITRHTFALALAQKI